MPATFKRIMSPMCAKLTFLYIASQVPAASARQPYQGGALSPKAPARRVKSLCIVLLAGAVALGVAVSGCGKSDSASAAHSAKQRYHCPMHPTYVSDRPGDCPICGMKLVPIKGDKAIRQASRRCVGRQDRAHQGRPVLLPDGHGSGAGHTRQMPQVRHGPGGEESNCPPATKATRPAQRPRPCPAESASASPPTSGR